MPNLDFPYPFANLGKDFDKLFVGFDDQFNKLSKMHDDLTKHIPNYPPYNIKKLDENKYVIEMAVAGFSKQNIEITTEGGVLTVTGSTSDDGEGDFLFKGIAERPFTRKFTLADTVEIKDAHLLNGMLKVFLENIIPESKKPKKINIQDKADSKPELLQEETSKE